MRNRLVGRGRAQGASPPAPLRMERGVICEVTPIRLLAYFVEFFSLTLVRFFSHTTHRFNRTFLAHVSNPQKAFGIQRKQSVSAVVDNITELRNIFTKQQHTIP